MNKILEQLQAQEVKFYNLSRVPFNKLSKDTQMILLVNHKLGVQRYNRMLIELAKNNATQELSVENKSDK